MIGHGIRRGEDALAMPTISSPQPFVRSRLDGAHCSRCPVLDGVSIADTSLREIERESLNPSGNSSFTNRLCRGRSDVTSYLVGGMNCQQVHSLQMNCISMT